MTRAEEEFRQQLIIAAVQGLCSNPRETQAASAQGLLKDVDATGIIAQTAISIADYVLQLEHDRETIDDG